MMADQALSAREGSPMDTDSPCTSASAMSGQTSSKTNIFQSDTHVANVLKKIQAKNLNDITLLANDGIKLDAHWMMLASFSDYFAPKPVEVNVDGATLKLIIDYMYSGKIKLSSQNVRSVLNAADHLQMGELIMACWDLIEDELTCLEAKKQKLIFIAYSSSDHLQVFAYNSESDKRLNRMCCPNPETRLFGYSLLLVNNKLFKAGGKYYHKMINSDYFECMDFKTMRWSALPPMLQTIEQPLMAETNGNLYMSDPTDVFFHKFDFSKNVWQRMRSLNFTPNEMLGYNGLVYAACDDVEHLEVYDPTTNEWSSTAPRKQDLKTFCIVGLNGYLYAIGGRKANTGEFCTSVECYCPVTDEWTVVKSFHILLRNMHCCAYNGRLLVCGSFGDVTRAEQYNPETNEWREFPLLSHMNTKQCAYLGTTLKHE